MSGLINPGLLMLNVKLTLQLHFIIVTLEATRTKEVSNAMVVTAHDIHHHSLHTISTGWYLS